MMILKCPWSSAEGLGYFLPLSVLFVPETEYEYICFEDRQKEMTKATEISETVPI